MGVKRPLEEESLPELSFEQHKQLDNNKRLAFVAEDFPSHTAVHEVDSLGDAKSDFCKIDSDGVLESSGNCDARVASKEVEGSEEDVGNKNTSFCSNFRGYIDFDMPWRPPQQFDDPYVYLLNVAPRKEIPIGPDHQAEVPKWDPSASVEDFSGANNFDNSDWEQKVIGTCIIPMPCLNESTAYEFTVGRGRNIDCSCLDMGSMRCVQQHVMESREKLRDTLGEEQFTKLGFYEMGEEEIARRWTSKDQELFQEIVFSNPGGDFWRHLSALFPSRTKKELISYYFNVFVLRRRGVQNRSYMLQIDSDHEEECKDARIDYQQSRPLVDDDDLQHVTSDFHLIGGEEDSEVESFCEQELDAGWVDDEYGSASAHVGVDDGTVDGDGLTKDDVYEGCNNNAGTFAGNVYKKGAVEMDNGTTGQVCGQETS